MKRRHALAAAGAALALAGGMLWRPRSEGMAPIQPTAWPELPVQALDGRSAALPAQMPHARLVNLWARWCAPCRRELPSLQRLADRLDPRHVEVLALAVEDDLFALREYITALQLRMPVWRLPAGQSARLDGSGTLPQTWLVAPDGRVLARWSGERDWDRSDLRRQVQALAESGA